MTFAAVAVGAAAVVGTVASSAISAGAAGTAASQQAQAAQNAQNISQSEFNNIQALENPYVQSGYGSLGQLNYLLGQGAPGTGIEGQGGPTATSSPSGAYGSLNAPFTAQTFQQYSPGYNFQMQQGQQGVLNGDAASQGGLSGASLKDLISYNQNYANTAYNNAFNQYQTQQSNTFSRLADIAGLGQAGASQQAASGTALTGQIAQSAQNIGSANAAGTIGIGNALSQGASSLGSLYALYGGGGGLNQSLANGNNVISNANAIEQAPF